LPDIQKVSVLEVLCNRDLQIDMYLLTTYSLQVYIMTQTQ